MNIREAFNIDNVEIDVSTVSQFIPVFELKYDLDTELEIIIIIKESSVEFDSVDS